MTLKEYGAYLKHLRMKSGISQGKLRKILNFKTPQHISNWERGISFPNPDHLKLLAKLFKVPYKNLVDGYIEAFIIRERIVMTNKLRKVWNK